MEDRSWVHVTAAEYSYWFTNTESLWKECEHQTQHGGFTAQHPTPKHGRSLWRRVCAPAELEGAVLSSQKVIHFLFPSRFAEDIEEDRNHGQEAGCGHHSYHQPCKCGVCKERDRGKCMFLYRGHWSSMSSWGILPVLDWLIIQNAVFPDLSNYVTEYSLVMLS